MKISEVFKKGVGAFFVGASICAVCALTPSSSYAGLLGTTAQGTYNIDASALNFYDPSASPGSAPVSATVVDPGVEYHSNDPAVQAHFPTDTVSNSAAINNNQLLLTWINQGFTSVSVPKQVFTFDLFPKSGLVNQKISGVTLLSGLDPSLVTFSAHQVQITYNTPFVVGFASSAHSLFGFSFVAVPEPGTYLLLGSMALVAVCATSRRRTGVLSS